MLDKKNKKVSVLFVDGANDLQSQIAEYFLREAYGDRYESYSAGPHKDFIDCDMISVMYQHGYDIRRAVSKDTGSKDLPEAFDYVVFLQRSTHEEIGDRVPPGSKVILKDFGSRSDFKSTDDMELFQCYTDLIERIRSWVAETFADPSSLDDKASA